MTRLDEALEWWRANDATPIPNRHLDTLDRNDCLVFVDDEQCFDLNEKGRARMRTQGFHQERGGFWKPKDKK